MTSGGVPIPVAPKRSTQVHTMPVALPAAPTPYIRCPKCNRPVIRARKFCGNCGSPTKPAA